MNDPVIVTGLRDGPLDVVSLIKQIWRTDCGAVVTFEGTTRSPSEGRDVERLEYEAYEERASTQLRALAGEAVERFGPMPRYGRKRSLPAASAGSASTANEGEA